MLASLIFPLPAWLEEHLHALVTAEPGNARMGKKEKSGGNRFPKRQFKRLSNGSVSLMSVSPVVQSTQGTGC